MAKRREASADREPDASLDAFRPMDRRRLKEIRAWLEGTRPDAPTAAELDEFLTWVALEIEWHLARHQPVQDLLALLNAAREQRRVLESGASDPR